MEQPSSIVLATGATSRVEGNRHDARIFPDAHRQSLGKRCQCVGSRKSSPDPTKTHGLNMKRESTWDYYRTTKHPTNTWKQQARRVAGDGVVGDGEDAYFCATGNVV